MRNIVVLGCGFAGYHAARKIEKSIIGRRRVRLTVVSRRAHLTFTPMLPAVAAGQLDPDQVTVPIGKALGPRTEIVIDEIRDIDLERRKLVGTCTSIPFDYLLVATGGVRRTDAFTGAEQLRGPDTVVDAIDIRDRLEELDRRDATRRRFAIIGASSTGVEWAAALANQRVVPKGDEPPEIELFERGDRVLPDHSRRISRRAAQILEELGIMMHLNHEVSAATATSVTVGGDQKEHFDAVFHCAGRRGLPLWRQSNLNVDDEDRLVVDQTLGIKGASGAFAAGDAVCELDGVPSASNPQTALQQGKWAARNLLADMSGRAKKPFHYDHRGDFVTLGRGRALLDLRGILLEGRPAWLAYRLYYTALMPRPFQKARLLVDTVARRLSGEPDDVPPSLPGE